MTKTQVLHERITARLRQGHTHAAIASDLGCSRSVVGRVAKRLAAATPAPQVPPAPPAARSSDPRERLETIRDAWLAIADACQTTVLEKAVGGAPAYQLSLQAGIATQRAMEIASWIELADGVPDELPADDDAARKAIKDAWWRAATLGGSAAAMTKLAASYGIKTQRGQPVKVSFERPGDAGGQAPAPVAVPG